MLLVQRTCTFLPLLVGLSLVSATAGALLAQTYSDQACFKAPPGGANRMPPCINFGRCYWGPEITGTCIVGQYNQPILSGDNFQEQWYGFCKLYYKANCEIQPPVPCMTYTAYIDAQCEYHPPGCMGAVMVPDCKTHF